MNSIEVRDYEGTSVLSFEADESDEKVMFHASSGDYMHAYCDGLMTKEDARKLADFLFSFATGWKSIAAYGRESYEYGAGKW
jgi:hypothetical protein